MYKTNGLCLGAGLVSLPALLMCGADCRVLCKSGSQDGDQSNHTWRGDCWGFAPGCKQLLPVVTAGLQAIAEFYILFHFLTNLTSCFALMLVRGVVYQPISACYFTFHLAYHRATIIPQGQEKSGSQDFNICSPFVNLFFWFG